MAATSNNVPATCLAVAQAQPIRVHVKYQWTGAVVAAYPGLPDSGTHAAVQATRAPAVESFSSTSREMKGTSITVVGRFTTIKITDKKELLMDRRTMMYAKWSGLYAHMLNYLGILVDKFDIRDGIRCRPLRDPETGEARISIEFTAIGKPEEIVDKEFEFRRNVVRSIPGEERRRFILFYHVA